jgi:hypothetical protein
MAVALPPRHMHAGMTFRTARLIICFRLEETSKRPQNKMLINIIAVDRFPGEGKEINIRTKMRWFGI